MSNNSEMNLKWLLNKCYKSKNKKGGTVSRVLYSRVDPGASIIYLSSLPPGKERATLDCRYIWPCRPQADTPMMSPSNGRRLLPCIFTRCRHRTDAGSYPAFSPLPLPGEGRLFSVTRDVSFRLPVLSTVRCSVLPGLSSPGPRGPTAIERPALKHLFGRFLLSSSSDSNSILPHRIAEICPKIYL